MKFRVKSLSNISMAALMLSGSRVPGYIREGVDICGTRSLRGRGRYLWSQAPSGIPRAVGIPQRVGVLGGRYIPTPLY